LNDARENPSGIDDKTLSLCRDCQTIFVRDFPGVVPLIVYRIIVFWP
jgi:hypothetical protein